MAIQHQQLASALLQAEQTDDLARLLRLSVMAAADRSLFGGALVELAALVPATQGGLTLGRCAELAEGVLALYDGTVAADGDTFCDVARRVTTALSWEGVDGHHLTALGRITAIAVGAPDCHVLALLQATVRLLLVSLEESGNGVLEDLLDSLGPSLVAMGANAALDDAAAEIGLAGLPAEEGTA